MTSKIIPTTEASKEKRKIDVVVATDLVYAAVFTLVATLILEVEFVGLASGCLCWYFLPSRFLRPSHYRRILLLPPLVRVLSRFRAAKKSTSLGANPLASTRKLAD